MYKQPVIRKIAAVFMLMVFAFSITPVIVFHNWLANHTDSCKKNTDTNQQQLGKQTFNCHCDHIVAESPFTETAILNSPAPARRFVTLASVDIVQLPASATVLYSLRGPPAV